MSKIPTALQKPWDDGENARNLLVCTCSRKKEGGSAAWLEKSPSKETHFGYKGKGGAKTLEKKEIYQRESVCETFGSNVAECKQIVEGSGGLRGQDKGEITRRSRLVREI